ncbi:MAG: glycoside hydrolase family 92 protein [Paludibacter sp.]|nr:glycoside hydrolase family 92 protein [Paludibacter sp.]
MNAKLFYALLFSLLTIVVLSAKVNEKSPALYVNPFIGNADNGHTFPGAAMPFGLVQASPETENVGWRYCSGYNYVDSTIIGFAQTHLNGTGCPDLGDILIFPFSGNSNRNIFKSAFDKKSQKATPGYYTVNLTDAKTKVELTASAHTAMHRYTFRDSGAYLLLDLQSGLSWDESQLHNRVLSAETSFESNTIISGSHNVNVWVNRNLFYVIEFNKPYQIVRELPALKGEKAKRLILKFDLKKGEQLLTKIAISTVSVDGAKNNLKAENPTWDFNLIRQKALAEWNKLLSRVEVQGTIDQKVSFYTSLYHLYLQPSNIADTDGRYRGADNVVVTSASKNYYSTFSLWDTYRAAHPLYTILIPEKVDDMVNSMFAHFNAVGVLPIWTLWGTENNCMIGNHSIPVIVDAYLKGFRGFDAEKLYEAIKSTLTKSYEKSNWEIYNKYGYYPFDLIKEESISRTLETCMDDFAAAQMAKALGKTDDYLFFAKRANNYKNVFDSTNNLMRGKDSNGKWRNPFDVLVLSHAGTAGGDYTEGNAWQYTWHVQQDIVGLANLFGGKNLMTEKLDSLFKLEPVIKSSGFSGDVSGLIGQYAHGNEPSHHVPYIFTLLGKPARTQELVREINNKFYLNKPDGLCGNDDCGQMSAWYIFTAMGFYPVNPVGGEYVFGAPQLPKISLSLPNSKSFVIEAKNLSEANKYVQRIFLNGNVYSKTTILHKDIMKGGSLLFVMGNKPVE